MQPKALLVEIVATNVLMTYPLKKSNNLHQSAVGFVLVSAQIDDVGTQRELQEVVSGQSRCY